MLQLSIGFNHKWLLIYGPSITISKPYNRHLHLDLFDLAFETRTATGSELFSLSLCLRTTKFILLSIFSPLEMVNIKMLETPLFLHGKCSLPVAVRVSKTRVLKVPSCSMGAGKSLIAWCAEYGSITNDKLHTHRPLLPLPLPSEGRTHHSFSANLTSMLPVLLHFPREERD